MNRERYCRARLIERTDVSEDLAVFRFEPEQQLSFTPGQFATLGLERPGERPLLRPYSVASAPHEPFLEFFVELVEDGALTTRLWSMQCGDTAWIRKKIAGLFILNEESARTKHLMAGTVTGVAPYVSIARDQQHALQQGRRSTAHNLLILHGGSRSWELSPYREELRTLASRVEWLSYVPTVSRPWEDPDWEGEQGRVEDVIRKHMDAAQFTPENAIAYACGHPIMIEKVRGLLQRTGFADDHIEEEKYFREQQPVE